MNIEPTPKSILSRSKLRSAHLTQLQTLRPTHALTLAYNDTVTIDRLRRDLRAFHAHLDRALFGRRFCTLPCERRTAFFAVPENVMTNTHVHMLMRVAEDRTAEFEATVPNDRSQFWARWAPRGTHRLMPLYDEDGWAKYCLKLMSLDGVWFDSIEFLSDTAFNRAA